tara:strand:+ start:87 stop:266 length:180 start_codon:yes stop_codon:yes gene_type:complete
VDEVISFTDIMEAFSMLKESKNAGLSTLEAIIMICYIIKDLLIVGGVLGTIIWFKRSNK